MLHRPSPAFIPALSLIALLVFSGLESRPAMAESFSGVWVDRQNNSLEMNISKENGLYKIRGGEESFGYDLSCLFKDMRAVCLGSGGQLQGEGFLYQSTMKLDDEGKLTEDWKAYNNIQTVTGQTIWQRPGDKKPK